METVSNIGLFILCCLISTGSAASLTATPDSFVEGATSELRLRCSVDGDASRLQSVLIIQLEKENNGSMVSLATLHSGAAAALDLSELTGKATARGTIEAANLSASYLEVTIDSPVVHRDEGTYVCVIMALDENMLITNIKDYIEVNGTVHKSPVDVQKALDLLMREMAAIKAHGSCGCSDGSGNTSQLDELKQLVSSQANEIDQLRQKVGELEQNGGGNIFLNGSLLPPVTPKKPLGFVAVGNAGSVQYDSVIYNTNGSFDLQHDHFTAPTTGFYFFHAYDSQPSNPLLALYLNDHPLANSAKAVRVGDGQNPVYSSLSVSGLVHLNEGDVVSTRYVSNTQNMGASFSGALVSASDG